MQGREHLNLFTHILSYSQPLSEFWGHAVSPKPVGGDGETAQQSRAPAVFSIRPGFGFQNPLESTLVSREI